MKRSAQAVWKGDLKSGAGTITTESGVLAESQYSFNARFADGKGTNPEELLAAAHAGCFTMALSMQLSTAGFPSESLATTCAITIDKKDSGFAITSSHLTLTAVVPGISQEKFDEATAAAKTGCPVSQLFNTTITLEASLQK